MRPVFDASAKRQGRASLNELKAKGKSAVLVTTEIENNEIFSELLTQYFSSYLKIIRMVARIMRLRKRTVGGPLTAAELDQAERRVLCVVQREGNCQVPGVQTNRDKDGLLRVTSRVVCEWETSLIILPQHVIVKLLIKYVHALYQHAGVGTVLSKLRERFWVIKGRNLVKKVLAECVRCKRFLGKHCQPPPSLLPTERTSLQAAPFQNSGMDLFGPLFLNDGSKVWGLLFTCAVYRCIRLEMVDSLSTETFVRALRRFLARNSCSYLYSDCGTNFIGLANQLQDIDWTSVAEFAASKRLTMKQAPPSAPWYGGFYERLVGVVKLSLKKTGGVASLSRDELHTILIEGESVVNSRPLTYCSSDIGDLEPLTPAHFLLEKPGVGAWSLDAVDEVSLVRRVQYLQSVRKHLRESFQKEYLNLLVQKAEASRGAVSIGDVVLVESDKKRTLWPLARVMELVPGKDGHYRVARVKTATGELVRPVQRLYPSEIRSADDMLGETALKEEELSPAVAQERETTTRLGRVVKRPTRYD